MKVVFLDFDGVLNSTQSHAFWSSKRDREKWENELYDQWKGTLYEYLALEFCPIAMSNVEELVRRVPDIKVVISSSWRNGKDVEALKKILAPAKALSNAVIDTTPRFHGQVRGAEIQDWLDNHPEVTHYVIIDDDRDMLETQKKNFVNTSSMHGFQYGDMLWALRILGEGDQC